MSTTNGDNCVGLMSGTLVRPIARYPSAIAYDDPLKVASNRVRTTLVRNVSTGDTLLTVSDASRLVPQMLLTISSEIISVSSISGNVLTVVRGFDGTHPACHSAGSLLEANITAWHHNALAAEITAIETALGPNLSNVGGGAGQGYYIDSSSFIWFRTNGINATGDLSGTGSKVITLQPLPQGLVVGNYVRLYGGTGTEEVSQITGITGTAGGNGTVIVSTANSHSGSWQISTASSGIQEALCFLPGPVHVRIPSGLWNIYGPVNVPLGTGANCTAYTISGTGRRVTKLMVASTFPLTAAGVFIASIAGDINKQNYGPELKDFGVVFIQPWGQPRSVFTHWPPMLIALGVSGVHLYRLYIAGAWNGIVLDCYPQDASSPIAIGGQHIIDDVQMSAFNIGVDMRSTGDLCRFHKLHIWPFTEEDVGTFQAQQTIYDSNIVGVRIEHCSGLFMSDSFLITGTSIDLVGNNSIIQIENCCFDVFASIRMGFGGASDYVSINNCHFYQNESMGDYSCQQPVIAVGPKGVQLSVSSCVFYKNALHQNLVKIVVPEGFNPIVGQLSFTGNKFYENSFNADTAALFSITGSAVPVWVDISGNQFSYLGNLAYTSPIIYVSGNGPRLSFLNNTYAGVGGGQVLSIDTDSYHNVANNQFFTNWGSVLPPVMTLGRYQDNDYTYTKQMPVITRASAVHTVKGVNEVILCDATAGTVQLNLPAANNARGAIITLKKLDNSANACFFQPTGGEQIDWAATASTSTPLASITIVSNGTNNWFKI